MKKQALIFAATFGWSVFANAQTVGDFRTHQTGNWSDVNSWERFDGATWITPVSVTPTSSDGVISILGGVAITVDSNLTVDQVRVNSNGTVIIASTRTLAVADGPDSIDMIVNGILNGFGTVTASGRISVESGRAACL